MALQNRVRPDGELVAVSARGSLMGNRGGRLHDPATRALGPRRWTSRRWICCALRFRGRHHTVWGDGYTELFFLDEVTALAAGHRPCFECRRREALAFAEAVARHDGLTRAPRASELDRRLHAERLDGREKRLHARDLASLDDGAVVLREGQFFAVSGDRLLRWSAEGYVDAVERPAAGDALCLTPPTALTALAAGFRPRWHPTAGPSAPDAGASVSRSAAG